MANKRNKELVSVIEANSSDWLEQVPANLGNLEGEVDAGGGLVYARLSNGFPIVAVNYVAPLIFDLSVLVGRSKAQRGFFQVIAVRETYINPASGAVKFHHEQHEYDDIQPGPDVVWVRRKQILSLTILVLNPAAFTVRLYGEHGQTATGIRTIPTQTLDLSSYVPTAGAKYVTIQSDDDGIVSVLDGTPVGAVELLTDADIPIPVTGQAYRGCVMLFETQTELLNKHIRTAWPLGVVSPDTGFQIHDAPEETELAAADEFGFWQDASEEIRKITYENLQLQILTLAWVPLSNSDPAAPELIFDANGAVVMVLENMT